MQHLIHASLFFQSLIAGSAHSPGPTWILFCTTTRSPIRSGTRRMKTIFGRCLRSSGPTKMSSITSFCPTIVFGESKYAFLGQVYELADFEPSSPETLTRLRGIIDDAFGRTGKTT